MSVSNKELSKLLIDRDMKKRSEGACRNWK